MGSSNMEEALRAKGIAEQKIIVMELDGAQKFAIRAKVLCPDLEGLLQLSAAIGVHAAARKAINNEPDWYGVLGVDPTADAGAIQNSYERLALYLHPDKNKARYAEGAFEIVSEANSILSSSLARIAYDLRRNKSPSASTSTAAPPTSTPPLAEGTFWTTCRACETEFEFMISYKNHKLRCPSCQAVFIGVESPRSQTTAAHTHHCPPRCSSAATPAPVLPSEGTFWTTCRACRTEFEFLARYRNHRLRCPNCQAIFLGVDNPHAGDASTSRNPPKRSRRA